MTKEGGKKTKNRKVFILIAALIAIAVLVATAFIMYRLSKDRIEGNWKIVEAKAEGVVMTTDDAKAIGLSSVGYFKLEKDGSCAVKMLDKEYAGKWKQEDEKKILIEYEDVHVIHATIDKNGNMQATDEASVEYKLNKAIF